MREWCSCGASIRAARRDVMKWRTTHLHTGDQEPDKQGSQAQVERADSHSHEFSPFMAEAPVVQARIGFHPNT